MIEFRAFPKVPRLLREMIITEKLDGTNASIWIDPTGNLITGRMLVGSRTRWITPDNDNHGFARWAYDHVDELVHLGPGHHFGEWWGGSIQRGYGLAEKRFSLFNASRWKDPSEPSELLMPENGEDWCPPCCHVVPVLYRGIMSNRVVADELFRLQAHGSKAAPGFMNPEGVIVYHTASGHLYKQTLKNDYGKEKTAAKERPPRAPKNKNGRRVAQDPAYCGPERRRAT